MVDITQAHKDRFNYSTIHYTISIKMHRIWLLVFEVSCALVIHRLWWRWPYMWMSLTECQRPPKGVKVYPASRWRSNKRVGLKGQLAPHCVPWLKNYIMAYKRLSTSLGSKTLNTSSLGLGGNHHLRPSCRRPPARTFHTPVGTLRLDAPALVWVRSPNDGNKLDQVN